MTELNSSIIDAVGGDPTARARNLLNMLSNGWVIVSNKGNGYVTSGVIPWATGTTGDIARGSNVISNVTGTLPVLGQPLSGVSQAYIPAGTIVLDITGNSIVMSNPATATATGFAIARGRWDTARVQHFNRTGKRVTALRLVYGNWGNGGGFESDNGNAVRVKVAVELAGTVSDQSGRRTKAFFDGVRIKDIDGGMLAYSDEIPCNIPNGGLFYERCAVTVNANGHIYWCGIATRGGTGNQGANTGEGLASNSELTDAGNTSDNSFSMYSACLVLGRVEDASVTPSVFIVGDSIAQASDDAGYAQNWGGWPYRAFEQYPSGWVPIGGEKELDTLNPNTFKSRATISAFATHIFDEYGRNDLAPSANRTAAQLMADVLTRARYFMLRGQHYGKSTILPEPTSSDGWMTVAGQTKSPFDAQRLIFNNWIRDTSGLGFVAQATAQVFGVQGAGRALAFDPCALMECNASGTLTANGGFVIPGTTTYTSGTATAIPGTRSIDDTGKAWGVNEHKGRTVEITAGTGAGQSRCILYNGATQLVVGAAFSPALDTTSQYRVTNAVGFTAGPHPHTRGHVLAANAIAESVALFMTFKN